MLNSVDASTPVKEAMIPSYQILLSKSSAKEFNGSCSCQFPLVNELPCVHIARAVLSYPEESIRNNAIRNSFRPRIMIETILHDYWNVQSIGDNSYGVKTTIAEKRRLKQQIQLERHVEESESQGKPCESNVKMGKKELDSFVSWANGKAMYDRMFRIASINGPVAVSSFFQLLRQRLVSLNRGYIPVLTR